MLPQQSLTIFAHRGAPLDPRWAAGIGVALMSLGALGLTFAVVGILRRSQSGRGFMSVLAILAGYAFAAAPLNLPGGNIAWQLMLWWFALPLLALPWLIWKYRQFAKGVDAIHEVSIPAVDEAETGVERIRPLLRPGEKILWWDKPAARRFRSEMIASVIFGLIPLSFSVIFLGLMGYGLWRDGMPWAMLPGYLIGAVAGFAFLAIGVGFILYPFKMASRLRHVVYAITDQRGLVLTSPRMFWNPVPSRDLGSSLIEFTPEQLRAFEKKWRDFGRTDIIVLKEWSGTGRRRALQQYGFLGLESPEEAESVLRAQFG